MALTATLQAAGELSREDRASMYRLMASHYDHVSQGEFDRDLAEKDAAILLHEPVTGQLRGFSTQVCFDHVLHGETLRIVFSGDTIIDPGHWGGLQLPVMFGRMMQALKREAPHCRLYWMLISKGFRTYRFLPVFFHRFYPRYDRTTPGRDKALMDALGRRKFPDRYDPATGVVRGGPGAQALHAELAESRCHQAQPDPHIAYFQASNPGHPLGDELLCLAEFDETNLRPFILRQLNRSRVQFPRVEEITA